MKNAQYTKEGAIEKLQGLQGACHDSRWIRANATYNRISTTDGTASQEMFAIGRRFISV